MSELRDDMKNVWMVVAERIGIPSILLALLLYGGYNLLQPVSTAVIENIVAQTQILSEIAKDTAETRRVLELDEAERKGDMLDNIVRSQKAIEEILANMKNTKFN